MIAIAPTKRCSTAEPVQSGALLRPDQCSQSLFCIRRCTHLWLTGCPIELHSAAVILLYAQRPLCSS